MASIYKNDKGFKVIEASGEEIINIGGLGICDHCGSMSTNGFYVAVLNRWFCPACFYGWYETATRYAEDIPIEERHFEAYRWHFGV